MYIRWCNNITIDQPNKDRIHVQRMEIKTDIWELKPRSWFPARGGVAPQVTGRVGSPPEWGSAVEDGRGFQTFGKMNAPDYPRHRYAVPLPTGAEPGLWNNPAQKNIVMRGEQRERGNP